MEEQDSGVIELPKVGQSIGCDGFTREEDGKNKYLEVQDRLVVKRYLQNLSLLSMRSSLLLIE